MSGEVILATGTTKLPTFLEAGVRPNLKRWTFLADPCFARKDSGDNSIKSECD
jgi:hypothetical protein